MRLRRLPALLLLGGLRLGGAFPSAAQGEPPARLHYLQAKIERDIRRTWQAGPIPYVPQQYHAAALTVQAYPIYTYYEPVGGTAGQYELRPDTLAGYATLYQAGQLVLTALTGGAGRYGFYPVNSPLAEKHQGLGSRDSTGYDIKLVQATLPYRSQAFLVKIPPHLAPDLMGYYDQGTLHFVDERGHVSRSAEELIVATFGSRARYQALLASRRQQAQKDQRWFEAPAATPSPRPVRPNKSQSKR